MTNPPDASTQIRVFLMSNPGQHCEACLVKGTALDARAVRAVFRPSRHNPYSFMRASCSHCRNTALCVAYAGELPKRAPAAALVRP